MKRPKKQQNKTELKTKTSKGHTLTNEHRGIQTPKYYLLLFNSIKHTTKQT